MIINTINDSQQCAFETPIWIIGLQEEVETVSGALTANPAADLQGKSIFERSDTFEVYEQEIRSRIFDFDGELTFLVASERYFHAFKALYAAKIEKVAMTAGTLSELLKSFEVYKLEDETCVDLDMSSQQDCQLVADFLAARTDILFGDKELGRQKLCDLYDHYGLFCFNDRTTLDAFYRFRRYDTIIHANDIGVKQQVIPSKDLKALQSEAIERGIPSMLFVTMLKSGTVYMKHVIQKKLGLPDLTFSTGNGFTDRLFPEYTKLFARGGGLTVRHLTASRENLNILADAGVSKIYLHIRDPRQSTLSYIHHLENNLIGHNAMMRDWGLVAPPSDYFTAFSWEEKIEWHGRNHFPGLVNWLTEWIHVADHDDRFQVLVTEFEEFRKDELAAVNKVLEFYELDCRVEASEMPVKEKSKLHFRKGNSSEWRDVFSKAQQEIFWSLLPNHICERFNWEK